MGEDSALLSALITSYLFGEMKVFIFSTAIHFSHLYPLESLQEVELGRWEEDKVSPRDWQAGKCQEGHPDPEP